MKTEDKAQEHMTTERSTLMTLNVNGFHAAARRGFLNFVSQQAPDVVCLQESRLSQPDVEVPGYHCVRHDAVKAGYAGTMVLSRQQPADITVPFDDEGRLTVVDVDGMAVASVYAPNSFNATLRRRLFRERWDESLHACAVSLIREYDRKRGVLLCGDFNVALDEEVESGFASDEQDAFLRLLDVGFKDVWKELYPGEPGFTWYGGRRRTGHRMDGVLASRAAQERILKAVVHPVHFSDHVPLTVYL